MRSAWKKGYVGPGECGKRLVEEGVGVYNCWSQTNTHTQKKIRIIDSSWDEIKQGQCEKASIYVLK